MIVLRHFNLATLLGSKDKILLQNDHEFITLDDHISAPFI